MQTLGKYKIYECQQFYRREWMAKFSSFADKFVNMGNYDLHNFMLKITIDGSIVRILQIGGVNTVLILGFAQSLFNTTGVVLTLRF